MQNNPDESWRDDPSVRSSLSDWLDAGYLAPKQFKPLDVQQRMTGGSKFDASMQKVAAAIQNDANLRSRLGIEEIRFQDPLSGFRIGATAVTTTPDLLLKMRGRWYLIDNKFSNSPSRDKYVGQMYAQTVGVLASNLGVSPDKLSTLVGFVDRTVGSVAVDIMKSTIESGGDQGAAYEKFFRATVMNALQASIKPDGTVAESTLSGGVTMVRKDFDDRARQEATKLFDRARELEKAIQDITGHRYQTMYDIDFSVPEREVAARKEFYVALDAAARQVVEQRSRGGTPSQSELFAMRDQVASKLRGLSMIPRPDPSANMSFSVPGKSLGEGGFVVFDLETGGFKPKLDAVLSLSFIVLDKQLKEIKRFSTLVQDPNRREPSQEALETNKIDMEAVRASGMSVGEAMQYLQNALKGRTAVAQNLGGFDKPFAEERGVVFGRVFDTLAEVQRLNPGIGNTQAEIYKRYFGEEPAGQHTSEGDVVALTRIFREMSSRGADIEGQRMPFIAGKSLNPTVMGTWKIPLDWEKFTDANGVVYAAANDKEIRFLVGSQTDKGEDIPFASFSYHKLPNGGFTIGGHLIVGGEGKLMEMYKSGLQGFIEKAGGRSGMRQAESAIRGHFIGQPYQSVEGVTTAYESILGSSVNIRRRPGESVQEVWAGMGKDAFFKDENAAVAQRLSAAIPSVGGFYLAGQQAYTGRGAEKFIKDMQKQNRDYVLNLVGRKFRGNIRMAGAMRPEELNLLNVFASNLETFTSIDPEVASKMRGTTAYRRYIPLRAGVAVKTEGLTFEIGKDGKRGINLGGFFHEEENWDNIVGIKAKTFSRGTKSFIELTGTGVIDPSRTMIKEWVWGKSLWMARELGIQGGRGDIEAITPIGGNVRQNAYVALMTKYRGDEGISWMRKDLERLMRRKGTREILGGSGYAIDPNDEEGALTMLRSAMSYAIQTGASGKEEFVWGHNANDPAGSKLLDAMMYFAAEDIFKTGRAVKTFGRLVPYESYLRYKMFEGKGSFSKVELVDANGKTLNMTPEQMERWAKRPGERMNVQITAEGFAGQIGVLPTIAWSKGEGVITLEETGQILRNAPYFSDQDIKTVRERIAPGWFRTGGHKREVSETVLKAHLMSQGVETPDTLGMKSSDVIDFEDLRAKLFKWREESGAKLSESFFEVMGDKKLLQKLGIAGKFIRMDEGRMYLAPLDTLNALTTFPESERKYEGDKDRKWSEDIGRRGQLNAMLNQLKRLVLSGTNDPDYTERMAKFVRAVDDIATSRTTIQNVGATHVGAEGMYVMDPQMPVNVLAAGPKTLMALFGTTDIGAINTGISSKEGLLALGIRRPNYSSSSSGVPLKVMRLADYGYGKNQEGMAISQVLGDLFQGDDDGDRMAAWAMAGFKAGTLQNQFEDVSKKYDERFGYGKSLRRLEMMYSNLMGREIKFNDIGEYVDFADRLYKGTGGYSEFGKANKPFRAGYMQSAIGGMGKTGFENWETGGTNSLEKLRQMIFAGEVMGHSQMGHAYNQFKRGLTALLGMAPGEDATAQRLADRMSYNTYQTALDKTTFSRGLRDLISFATSYSLQSGLSRDYLSPTPGAVPQNDPAILYSKDKTTPTLQREIIRAVLTAREFRGGGVNARWIDDIARMISKDEAGQAIIKRVLMSDKEVGGVLANWEKLGMDELLSEAGDKTKGFKSKAQEYDVGIQRAIEKNSYRLADEINKRAFGEDVSVFASEAGEVAEPVMAQVFERWDRGGRKGDITGMVDSRIMQNLINTGKGIRAYTQFAGGRTGPDTAEAYRQLKRAKLLSSDMGELGGILAPLGRKLKAMQDPLFNASKYTSGNMNDVFSMLGNVDEAALLQRIKNSSIGLNAGSWLKIIGKIEKMGLRGEPMRMTPEMTQLSEIMNPDPQNLNRERYGFKFTKDMIDPAGELTQAAPGWASDYFNAVKAALMTTINTAPGAANFMTELGKRPFEKDTNLFEWMKGAASRTQVAAARQGTQSPQGPSVATAAAGVSAGIPADIAAELKAKLQYKKPATGPIVSARTAYDLRTNQPVPGTAVPYEDRSWEETYGKEGTPEFFLDVGLGKISGEKIEELAGENKITAKAYQLATGLQKGTPSVFPAIGGVKRNFGGMVSSYMKDYMGAKGQTYNEDFFENLTAGAQVNAELDGKLKDLGKSVEFVSQNFKTMNPYLKTVAENFQKMGATDLGKVEEMFGHVRNYGQAVERGLAAPIPGMADVQAAVGVMTPDVRARLLRLKTGMVGAPRRGGGGGGMFGGGGGEDDSLLGGGGGEEGGRFAKYAPSGRGIFTGDWGSMYFGMLNLQRAWKYTGGGVTDAMGDYAKYAQQQQYAGSMLGEGVGYTGPVQTVMGVQSNAQRFMLGLGRAGWDSRLGRAATNAAGMLGDNDPDNPGWMQKVIADAAPIVGIPLVLAVASGVAGRLGMSKNVQGFLNFVPGALSSIINTPMDKMSQSIGPAVGRAAAGLAGSVFPQSEAQIVAQRLAAADAGFTYAPAVARAGLFSAGNMGAMGASLGALSVGQIALLTGGSLAVGGLAGNALMNAIQGTSYTLPQRVEQGGTMFQQAAMIASAERKAGGVPGLGPSKVGTEAFAAAMRDELEKVKPEDQKAFDRMYGGFSAISAEMQKWNPASDPNQAKAIAAEYSTTFGRSTEQMRGDVASGFAGEARFLAQTETVPPELRKSALQYALTTGKASGLKFGDKGFAELGQRYLDMSPAARARSDETLSRSSAFMGAATQWGVDLSGLTKTGPEVGAGRGSRLEQMQPQELMELNRLASGDRGAWARQGEGMGHPEWVTMEADTGYDLGTTRFAPQLTNRAALNKLSSYGNQYLVSEFNRIAPYTGATGRGGGFDMRNADYTQPSTVNIGGEQVDLNIMSLQDKQLKLTRENQQFQFKQQNQQWGLGYLQRAAGGGLVGGALQEKAAAMAGPEGKFLLQGQTFNFELGGQARQITMTGSGQWQFELANQQLGRMQQGVQFGFQREQLALSSAQFGASQGLQRQRMETEAAWGMQGLTRNFGRQQTQFGWGREDLAFQGEGRALQFGWNMEDIDLNMRYATGRERRQLSRQRERATISYGRDVSQQEREEDRLGVREGWGRQDYTREMAQARQRLQWGREEMNLASTQHSQNMDLARRRLSADEEYFAANIQLQDKSRISQEETADLMAKKDLEMIANAQTYTKNVNDLTTAMDLMTKSNDAAVQQFQVDMSTKLGAALQKLVDALVTYAQQLTLGYGGGVGLRTAPPGKNRAE